MIKLNFRAGFSLLEIILVLAIIGVIAGVATSVYLSYQTKNNLDLKANIIAQGLRQAQTLAMAAKNDSAWGVKINATEVVIFSGSDYASRDIALDITFLATENITTAGWDEVVFSKLSGVPDVTGNLTLTSPNNASRTLALNSFGVVSY